MQHASWLLIAVINIRQTSEKQPTYNYLVLMALNIITMTPIGY
jgi:hypothetical protein